LGTILSIMLTLRITLKIQKNEFNFRKEQAERDEKLLFYQNKPCPYLDLRNYPEEIRISIQNAGTGPLLITKWNLIFLNDDVEYRNFHKLFCAKLWNEKEVKINMNTAPTHNIASNGEKELLYVKIEDVEDMQRVKSILGETTLKFSYEDVFENKFEFTKDLSFFRQINK